MRTGIRVSFRAYMQKAPFQEAQRFLFIFCFIGCALEMMHEKYRYY